MTITTVCAAIASIGQSITGITGAFDPPPPSIETAELPALYVLTSQAVDDTEILGDNFVLETRQYRVQVAVSMREQSTPEQIEGKTRTILSAVKLAFHSRPSLGGISTVQGARVTGDSGIVNLTEYNGAFIGFEVRLEVQEYIPRTFASGE